MAPLSSTEWKEPHCNKKTESQERSETAGARAKQMVDKWLTAHVLRPGEATGQTPASQRGCPSGGGGWSREAREEKEC